LTRPAVRAFPAGPSFERRVFFDFIVQARSKEASYRKQESRGKWVLHRYSRAPFAGRDAAAPEPEISFPLRDIPVLCALFRSEKPALWLRRGLVFPFPDFFDPFSLVSAAPSLVSSTGPGGIVCRVRPGTSPTVNALVFLDRRPPDALAGEVAGTISYARFCDQASCERQSSASTSQAGHHLREDRI